MEGLSQSLPTKRNASCHLGSLFDDPTAARGITNDPSASAAFRIGSQARGINISNISIRLQTLMLTKSILPGSSQLLMLFQQSAG
jgi:hypothetical protein